MTRITSYSRQYTRPSTNSTWPSRGPTPYSHRLKERGREQGVYRNCIHSPAWEVGGEGPKECTLNTLWRKGQGGQKI